MEGECQYPGDSNRRIGGGKYVLQSFLVCHGIRSNSGLRHVPGETGKTCKRAAFLLLLLLFPRVTQGISGNKVENGIFFI